MSQFDLPRINFHGTARLDTATANNGNYEPSLTMFDQDESEAFLPPRCYLPSNNQYQPPAGVEILTDSNGNKYVPITPITTDNYQKWASTPLGSFHDDRLYWGLYAYLKVGSNQSPLLGNTPGYWNYFGDLSMSLIDTEVTGITLPKQGGGVITYTPQNQEGCPSYFAEMFGALLSFNNNFFALGSSTSAYLSDADSIGQMCTQVFCGQAGLYKRDQQGNQTTFFNGTPVKSTAHWMNLNKVLNYSDPSIIPMGGSACFYAMIALNSGTDLAKNYQQYTGQLITGLFMKFLIHEVYEVRQPDYTKIPTKTIYDIAGNQIPVPKNPVNVSVSGSITPFYDGDMKTASISRLMKNITPLALDTSKIPPPVTKAGTPLSVANSVNLAPIQFWHNKQFNLLTLDITNSVNEYGTDPGALVPYAGGADIPPFQSFESFDYGIFSLYFKPDNGAQPSLIGTFNFTNDYQMQQLLASAGMIDFGVPGSADFSKGIFYIILNGATIYTENNYFILSDQMGNYAEEGQPTNNYMSDGLPRIPCSLRVFYRGESVDKSSPLSVTRQAIDIRSGSITNTPNFSIYDGMQVNFPVDKDGCITYAFIDSQSAVLQNDFSNLFSFIMNSSLVVLRTLSARMQLTPYLNGSSPITWDTVFNNVFSLYKVLYPVMDAVVPFNQANWSDPSVLSKMMMLIDEKNWNQPLYMPVTRDLSGPQRQLLQMWANQNNNNAANG
jgi:hypothetical protein